MSARHSAQGLQYVSYSQLPSQAGLIISILHLRKLKFWEVKELAQDFIAENDKAANIKARLLDSQNLCSSLYFSFLISPGTQSQNVTLTV